MEYRSLGRSGLKTSPLWLGTMMFGDRTDEAEAGRIVAAAREAGVNAIDTADQYAKGASERLVGKLVAGDRHKWIVATKLGNIVNDPLMERGLSRRWMMKACDDSLKRLGTDYIDIYYLHREDPDTPLEETVDALGRLHAIPASRISAPGASRSSSSSAARPACRSPSSASPTITR